MARSSRPARCAPPSTSSSASPTPSSSTGRRPWPQISERHRRWLRAALPGSGARGAGHRQRRSRLAEGRGGRRLCRHRQSAALLRHCSKSLGAHIVERSPSPTTTPSPRPMPTRILRLAGHNGAALVTTEKDWVRLSGATGARASWPAQRAAGHRVDASMSATSADLALAGMQRSPRHAVGAKRRRDRALASAALAHLEVRCIETSAET